ncbi:response regulator transcription factor [Paenibacillus sp. SYP-B4298]|uniref:response regulator transcription factor n=1 Tax=Paenibacillus sp. SYP-B4298 TaxID=2996034 RepID=UPI0022DDFF1F|nr:response regulator transcription factor [Paenibacillus sp. SYP-B4298]
MNASLPGKGQPKKLLLIEDEEAIADILSYALRKEGYTVRSASTGAAGLRLLEQYQPDLLLLDVMLPDMDGFDICRRVASEHAIPIIMLTARDELIDKIVGLELGADDYMTKPFDIREVAARIKAALRRTQRHDGRSRIKLGERMHIQLDPAAREVFKDGHEIKLKPKEFELLLLLSEAPGRVFTREEILSQVWEMDYDGDLRTVDVHVQRLRKKLDTSLIDTVFGVGYKLRGAKP